MSVLGVDACRLGWLAVELDDTGRFVAATAAEHLSELLGEHEATGVDMPIGLQTDGWRHADQEAAEFVGARRASVFRVPPRDVWTAPDYVTANARCRSLTDAGMSRQAWALRDKLLEVNSLHEEGAALHEVHPEVSFRAMAGTPLLHGKRTWTGQRQRERLLRHAGIELPAAIGAAGDAAVDDVLDAAAAAWSARRIAVGQARSIPEPPESGIAIWY